MLNICNLNQQNSSIYCHQKGPKPNNSIISKLLIQTTQMFRALQQDAIKRHLKIQNVFSSKKHHIYYSHDENTLETYLTKIIHSPQNQIIDYYKHHITNNVLPYLITKSNNNLQPFLQLRNSPSHPSLIALNPELEQAIVKICNDQRNKRLAVIEQKLRDIAALTEQLEQLRDNSIYKKRLETALKNLCDQEEHSIGKIRKQKLIKNIKMLVEIISFKTNYPEQSHLIKEQQLQIQIENIENQIQPILQKLARIDDLYHQFFKQKGQKPLSMQMVFELQKRLTSDHLLEQQQIYLSNTLILTKKFIPGTNLRQMILDKDNKLTGQFCQDLVGNIVDFIFLYGGIKDLFITTENIIVEDTGAIHFNYLSLLGLQFIKCDKYVTRSDFEQILPYIHAGYLSDDSNKRIFDTQIHLRFIMVNFISAFFKKDIIFSEKYIEFQVQVQRKNAEKQLKRVTDELMREILQKQQIQQLVKYDMQKNVNYLSLVSRIFFKQQHELIANVQMSKQNNRKNMIKNIRKHRFIWTDILGCLSQQGQKVYSSIQNENDNPVFKCKLNSLPANNKIFNMSILQFIDHYTSILSQLSANHQQRDRQSNRQQTKFDQVWQKVKRSAQRMEYQRQYFVSKDWYCKQLYIPIKTGMTFTQILKYEDWVNMLIHSNKPNQKNIKAIQNLIAFMLEIKQIMTLLQPYITAQLISKSLTKIAYDEFKQVFKVSSEQGSHQKVTDQSYYILLIELNDRHISNHKEQIDDDDSELGILSSDQQKDKPFNLKQQFWNKFFYIYNKLMLMIKLYYLRVTQVEVNFSKKHSHKLRSRINQANYIQIIQKWEQDIPLTEIS